MITRDSVVIVSDSLIVADIEDEAVLLDKEKGVYYGLNEIGTSIFDRLDEPRTAGEIIEKMKTEYDVDSQRLADDVVSFLNKMYDRGLVRVKTEASKA